MFFLFIYLFYLKTLTKREHILWPLAREHTLASSLSYMTLLLSNVKPCKQCKSVCTLSAWAQLYNTLQITKETTHTHTSLHQYISWPKTSSSFSLHLQLYPLTAVYRPVCRHDMQAAPLNSLWINTIFLQYLSYEFSCKIICREGACQNKHTRRLRCHCTRSTIEAKTHNLLCVYTNRKGNVN